MKKINLDLTNKNLLAHKSILITGATAGLGLEAAQTYAEYGAKNLILLGTNSAKLDELKQKMTGAYPSLKRLLTFELDFRNKDFDYQKLTNFLLKEGIDALDGLLHSAGILGKISSLEDYPLDLWQEVMQINVTGALALTQALLPFLRKSQNGSLVFTSSSVGRSARQMWGAYSVSKVATEALMQIFSQELANTNIRCNSLNPGATATKMRAQAYPQEDARQLAKPKDRMPLYLYLMSDASRGEKGEQFNA